jgi:hypothetical protein
MAPRALRFSKGAEGPWFEGHFNPPHSQRLIPSLHHVYIGYQQGLVTHNMGSVRTVVLPCVPRLARNSMRYMFVAQVLTCQSGLYHEMFCMTPQQHCVTMCFASCMGLMSCRVAAAWCCLLVGDEFVKGTCAGDVCRECVQGMCAGNLSRAGDVCRDLVQGMHAIVVFIPVPHLPVLSFSHS